MSRLPYASISPDGFAPLMTLSNYMKTSGLESALLHIVYLRISQINGCPYCIDLHWRDARAEGEDERKLNGVVLWRDMPFFSERERAALAWAEAVTLLRDQHVSEEEFQNAHKQFNDKELVNLTLAIANMNAMNRVAIAFHSVPVLPKKEVTV